MSIMDAPALPKKLFHAVVVLGMVSIGTTACSSDSTPSPGPGTDAGNNPGKDDAGNNPGKDAATTDSGGGNPDAGNPDAFAGWAPCH